MFDTAEEKYKYDKNPPKLSRAPQGRRLGDERLEVLVLLVALGELPLLGMNWAAVECPERKKYRRGKSEYTTILNKYNTNYEALRLSDSTALAFKFWQNFIKAIYYKLMNYH